MVLHKNEGPLDSAGEEAAVMEEQHASDAFGKDSKGGHVDATPNPVFRKLCAEGNVSEKLQEDAWNCYEAVAQRCSLEGNQVPWYASAIYLTSWQKSDESFDRDLMVSVFRLSQLSELTILEFFEKLTKWVEMATTSRRIHDHMSRIQRTFAVSAVIFKKFLHIFRFVFAAEIEPTPDTPTKTKSKRHKKPADIQPTKLLEFAWMLYICTKKNYVGIGDDLMNCFHLLLCCVGMVHKALLAAKRIELLKPAFAAINQDGEEFGILETLCEKFEGCVLDAKHFQVHWWYPKMQKLLSEGMLIGSVEDGTLVEKIDENVIELSDMYGQAMLERGEMDERAFLPEDISSLLVSEAKVDPLIGLKGTPEKCRTTTDTDLLLRLSVQSCLEKMSHYKLPTPLSGKSYTLPGDQFCPQTPISSSAQVASKLSSLLSGSAAPSLELEDIFEHYDEMGAKQLIFNILNEMKGSLEERCLKEKKDFGQNYDESFTEFLAQRLEQAETLFYRFLERIIVSEKERASFDFTAALRHDAFHRSLFACSLELIIFSYNSQRLFPWVIRAMELPAISFYKVIELVIRAEPELSREMVKHLNTIEERVLEELAWTKDSPLWETLENFPWVPACQEVALPSQINRSTGVPTIMSAGFRRGEAQSPFGVSGRFMSPIKQSVLAKRKLDFGGGSVIDSGSPPSKLNPNREELGKKQTFMAGLRLPGTVNVRVEPTDAGQEEMMDQQPKKSTSLTLFFRKVYYLASVRLSDLCERLRLDEKTKQNVWTMLEHTLQKYTFLMAGRHLDQILMCSLYAVAKLHKIDVSFHDILSQYRYQPQAASRVYRSVLMENSVPCESDGTEESCGGGGGGKQLRSRSTLPVPGMSSAPPTPEPMEEEFGDLIRFYNRVFITHLEHFAKQLVPGADSQTKENLTVMSPIPNVRSHVLSPRKRVADGIYVCPLQSPGKPISPVRPMRYNFSRSPYKDLKAINSMIKQGSDQSKSPRLAAHGYSGVKRVLHLSSYMSGR